MPDMPDMPDMNVVDDCKKRLLNLDGRIVHETDINYKYVYDDCITIKKRPKIFDTPMLENGVSKIVHPVTCK
jgi:hypothetical protein